MSRDFVDWIVKYDVKDTKDLARRVQDLETWGKFEQSEKIKAWAELFDKCVADEWDEETSYQPIPMHPPYIFEGDFDLDMNGWYHSWELPDGYEPQDTYYEE